MVMRQTIKRHIGRILLDGGFMTNHDLDCALEEQKRTKELLGEVLVRMGVLKAGDVTAPLLIQGHLGRMEDAVRIAAGERQLLGALLVQSGQISGEQLDSAIDEQKRTGEKLGEVFIRLGMLTEQQLIGLLEFQQNQVAATANPLRLGELLIATGNISREQLEDALHKQTLTRKKLGEVLVDEGYVSAGRVKYGIKLQRMLLNAVLAAILSLGTGSAAFAASVQILWDPNTEADLAGYKVYYSADPAPLAGSTPIDVHNQTSATISGLDPEKSYKFAVTAYNTAGQESELSDILSVEEQSAPSVAIDSPSDSANVSGVVNISVTASDNVGVTKVEYYVNGQLKSTETAAPYVYSWDVSQLATGVYTLMAKAYDAAGNVRQSNSPSVTVVNDTIAPVVAVTSPANKAVLNGTVTISAGASDNVGVSMVEIYCNGALLFAGNAAPYSFNWDTRSLVNGSYTLTARAYDNSGNISNSSAVSVTVNNFVLDISAPTVTAFTLPATSTSLTVPVSSLTAADNVAINGYMITESAAQPAAASTAWSATAPSNFTFSADGTRTAYAWVRDGAGNVSAGRSASVAITLPADEYTISDAMLALQIAVGKVKPTNAQKTRLDVAPVVDGKSAPNAKIDTADAIVILSKVTGKK